MINGIKSLERDLYIYIILLYDRDNMFFSEKKILFCEWNWLFFGIIYEIVFLFYFVYIN